METERNLEKEIESLEEENARLREALEKITDLHSEDGGIMQRVAYEALDREYEE